MHFQTDVYWKGSYRLLCHCTALWRQQAFDGSCAYMLQGFQSPLQVSKALGYEIDVLSSCNSWNEWLTLPIKYCELPPSAQCAITVWDTTGPRQAIPVGGTTLQLFGKY